MVNSPLGKYLNNNCPIVCIGGLATVITINHCRNCDTDFMIPAEYSDGLDITMFLCPNCKSRNWVKLTDFGAISVVK